MHFQSSPLLSGSFKFRLKIGQGRWKGTTKKNARRSFAWTMSVPVALNEDQRDLFCHWDQGLPSTGYIGQALTPNCHFCRRSTWQMATKGYAVLSLSSHCQLQRWEVGNLALLQISRWVASQCLHKRAAFCQNWTRKQDYAAELDVACLVDTPAPKLILLENSRNIKAFSIGRRKGSRVPYLDFETVRWSKRRIA